MSGSPESHLLILRFCSERRGGLRIVSEKRTCDPPLLQMIVIEWRGRLKCVMCLGVESQGGRSLILSHRDKI